MAAVGKGLLVFLSFLLTAAFLNVLYQSAVEGEAISIHAFSRGPICMFPRNHGIVHKDAHLRVPINNGSVTIASIKQDSNKYPPLFRPPLRTKGRYILDADGRRFKFASINWYGASDVLFIPGGLEILHRSEIAATIRRMGFNSVRLPYSDELVLCNPIISSHLVPANADLAGKRALDIYEATVAALTDAGIAVIINNHITHARWFDGFNLCDATWKNEALGPFCRVRQTEDTWIENWQEVMSRFIDNPLVIGADLRNEIHGFWGTVKWNSWAKAAERAGEALLAMQPNWLLIVEGLSSANDLSDASEKPIRLSIPDRVVYSSHVYSWSGWGQMDPFSKRAWPSFRKQMHKNWGFLLEQDIAPVWVGEFGAPQQPDQGNAHYWRNLMRYLHEVDADFGYWALNARKPADNSREGYSVVQNDWRTEISGDYRMRDMRQLMIEKSDRPKDWWLAHIQTDW